MPSLSCVDLGFSWPDGTRVLDSVNLSLGPEFTSLIGDNGAGKSTLLRLIAGELTPTEGHLAVDGSLAHLPQNLPLATGATVAEVLGIDGVLADIARADAGRADGSTLERIGSDWDIGERATATLDRLDLGHLGLDRVVGTVSGGEAVLLGLAAHLIAQPGVLLLDEPTNNLDSRHRRLLSDALGRFTGVLVVISHDRELLEGAHRTVELSAGTAKVYGGNFSHYRSRRGVEQEAADQRLRSARAELDRQRRELIQAQQRQARRQSSDRRKKASGGIPKIVVGELARRSQVSAARDTATHRKRISAAEEDLRLAREAVEQEQALHLELPGTEVPSRREILACEGLNVAAGGGGPLWERPLDLHIRGPERVAVAGPNGAGKTTLLRTVVGELSPAAGRLSVRVPLGYLPQRLDVLDDSISVIANVRRGAAGVAHGELTRRLARFALRGGSFDQLAGTLSGGERFRAVLATLLLADPPPQLLVLDEPTNSLDLRSVAQLESALEAYRGAVLVVSHDRTFLEALGPDRTISVPPVD